MSLTFSLGAADFSILCVVLFVSHVKCKAMLNVVYKEVVMVSAKRASFIYCHLKASCCFMYSILNMSGSVTGYVLGDYFLSVEMAKAYFDIMGVVKPTYGTKHADYIVSSINGSATHVTDINAKTFPDFIEQCGKERVKLHDMLFVPCKYSDFDWWRHNGIWTLDGCFLYQCVYKGEVVGYLSLNANLFTSKSVLVVMLEVINKREGHGTRIVQELKSRGLKLNGVSTIDAASFWIAQGADLQEFNRFKI